MTSILNKQKIKVYPQKQLMCTSVPQACKSPVRNVCLPALKVKYPSHQLCVCMGLPII